MSYSITVDKINKMIDYCIKMPEKEEYEKGHRYPYYSCEILCSTNGFNIDKLLSTQIENNDNLDKKKDNNNENKNSDNNESTDKEKKIEEELQNNHNKNEENENNIKDGDKKNEEIQNKNEEDGKEAKKEKNEEEDNNKEEEKDNNNAVDNKKEEEEEKMDIDSDEDYEVDVKTLNGKEKKKEVQNIALVYSIFDHFFSFLQDKTSFENCVLMGYFHKITNYLIKTKTKIILDYMLINRENVIIQLLSHINSYSISNIITNILNALSEYNIPDANDKYMMIINKLLEQLNLNENDNNTIEIICELIINGIIYNNKIKLSKIIDENIINKFEEIIQKYYENYTQNKNKILSVINLLTKMNKSLLSNVNNKITSTINSDDNKNEMMNIIRLVDKTNNHFTSINNNRYDFQELVFKSFLNNYITYCNSINNICIIVINNLIQQEQNQDNNNEDIEISFSSKKCHKLGLQKIIEFEFIKSVLDLYINCLGIFYEDKEKKKFIVDKIKLIINTSIFKFVIEHYFKFKINNFMTNIMIDFIKIIFDNDKAPEELVINFLQLYNKNEINKENNLITLIMNDIIKNTKFIFENSNNVMNDLLFGSNLTILNYIFSSKNPYINNIYEKLPKEKFFYDNFIINIINIFSKKLYKIEENTEKPEFDALGIRLNSLNGIKGKSEIPFSVESLNDLINFYLKVTEKYFAGEEYISLFKERENRIEEIKKSKEYIRLGNQNKDEDYEMEEEEEEYDDVDIPKPVFFNSKLDEKKEKEDKEENNKEGNNTVENKDNINNNNKCECNDIYIENKNYNDVNYWQTGFKDENMENILKELM